MPDCLIRQFPYLLHREGGKVTLPASLAWHPVGKIILVIARVAKNTGKGLDLPPLWQKTIHRGHHRRRIETAREHYPHRHVSTKTQPHRIFQKLPHHICGRVVISVKRFGRPLSQVPIAPLPLRPVSRNGHGMSRGKGLYTTEKTAPRKLVNPVGKVKAPAFLIRLRRNAYC